MPDDDAFAAGLTCGGFIDVFVENVSRDSFSHLGEVAEDTRDGRIHYDDVPDLPES